MKDRAARFLALVLPAALALFVLRNLPLLANRDDFLRLYCGGYVGCVTLRGGGEAARMPAALAAIEGAFADEYTRSRFVVAQIPYSPLTLALVCLAEGARSIAGAVDLARWTLAVQTALWLVLLAAAAALAGRVLGTPAVVAFAVVGLGLAWIHVHTNPLLPVPRCVAALGTAMAMALLLTGRSEAWAHGWLAVAAFAHPYNQALNLAIAGSAALVLRGSPAGSGWRDRIALRLALGAAATVALAVAVVRAANPRGQVAIGEMWAHGANVLAQNWAANRGAVARLVLLLGVALTAAVFRLAGARRAGIIAALFVTSVTLPALLWPAGVYPGELPNRVGGAWAAVLFAIALRGDLLPGLDRLAPRRATVAAAAMAAAAAAGAVPELLGIRTAPHYAPWLRPPRVEASPGVERECLALIERGSRR
jgi:hypothetical protein